MTSRWPLDALLMTSDAAIDCLPHQVVLDQLVEYSPLEPSGAGSWRLGLVTGFKKKKGKRKSEVDGWKDQLVRISPLPLMAS